MDNTSYTQPAPQPGVVQQPQMPAQPANKSSNTALIIVVVVLAVLFVGLPVGGLFLARDYLTSDEGKKTVNKVINLLENDLSENYVAGSWKCKYSQSESTYSVGLELNEDGTFRYGQYGDLYNNSYSGTYTSEYEEEKRNTINGANYYIVKFHDVTMKKDGVSEETLGLQNLEMGIGRHEGGDKREAATAWTQSMDLMFCVEE